MKRKLLIVEDEDAIRTGLVDLLAFKGYSPFAVEDGQKAIEAIDSNIFQIMLIDVMLPFVDGYAVCAHARKVQPKSGIMMLTAKSQEQDIIRGFEAGCDDYITKPFSIKPLLLRIAALDRRLGVSTSIGKLMLHPEMLQISYGERKIEISVRDMEVLSYLFEAQNRIVDREELLREVWGYQKPKNIQTRCVDMHITKLRKKLKPLAPEHEFIRTVRGVGYCIEEPS